MLLRLLLPIVRYNIRIHAKRDGSRVTLRVRFGKYLVGVKVVDTAEDEEHDSGFEDG